MSLRLALPFGLFALLATAASAAPLPPETACKAGAYAMPGAGRLVLSVQGEGSLGVLMPDGERGSLQPQGNGRFVQAPPAPPLDLTVAGCPPSISLSDGRTAPRVAFDEVPLTILGDGVILAGKLVTPIGRSLREVAIFVDGSDQVGAVDRTYWQYVLPLRGVGVLILDKRGTGGSTGQPTANFNLRADDVIAAVRAVRARVEPGAKVGLIGFSQGGWVAPLAASREPVDFVMVAYGMAEGVTDEDREEIIQNLEAAGFGAADIRDAVELQTAAAEVVKSHWVSGWERFDALKARYAGAPWLKAMGQEGFTGMMVATPSAVIRQLGPKVDLGVSFEYAPAPVIAALRTRQLWILGGDDHSAPSARTRTILTDLQKVNPGLAIAVFPKADHGITETTHEGGFTHIRLSAGYLDLVARWIRTGRVPRLPGVESRPAGRGTTATAR